MKWVLNKWGGRERRRSEMLKRENESVNKRENVETIEHGELLLQSW